MRLKPSSLAWVRLNSVAVIRAARPGVVRAFVAAKVGFQKKLKSLDDLEPSILDSLNHTLSKTANAQLEAQFLEFLKGPP
jgi:hypothetical protein